MSETRLLDDIAFFSPGNGAPQAITAPATNLEGTPEAEKVLPGLEKFLQRYRRSLTKEQIATLRRLQNEFEAIIMGEASVLTEILEQVSSLRENIERLQALRGQEETTQAGLEYINKLREKGREAMKDQIESTRTGFLTYKDKMSNDPKIEQWREEKLAPFKQERILQKAGFQYLQTQKFLDSLREKEKKLRDAKKLADQRARLSALANSLANGKEGI